MNTSRRLRWLGSLALASTIALPLIAYAQAAPATWPTRAIRLIVGYPPGGANDQLARQLGPRLGEALGQTIVVENRPGADGVIGTRAVAKADADGYTLALAGLSPLVLSSFMFANIPYNAKEDLVGISTIASSPIMFAVNPSLPIQSFAALVDYARKNPGQVNFATAGAGGSSRMMVELFKQTTGTDVGYISYKGASQALTDLVAGRVGAMAIDFSALYPMVEQGRLRALAITSDHRNKHLPDVPTVAEAGYPSLQAGNWYAVMAPANTPDAIISKLNAALRKVSGSADMIKALDPMGMEGMTQSSSTTFSRFLTDEFDRWGEVVTKAGITAE